MTFRLAERNDIDTMVRIERESFGSRAFTREQFESYVRKKRCYVVSANYSVIAYCVVFVRANSRTARINVIAVDPVFTGRGWGSSLLHEVEQLHHCMAYNYMSLEVNKTNTRAISLYKLRGYEIAGELADYYGPGETGIKMIKTLS